MHHRLQGPLKENVRKKFSSLDSRLNMETEISTRMMLEQDRTIRRGRGKGGEKCCVTSFLYLLNPVSLLSIEHDAKATVKYRNKWLRYLLGTTIIELFHKVVAGVILPPLGPLNWSIPEGQLAPLLTSSFILLLILLPFELNLQYFM